MAWSAHQFDGTWDSVYTVCDEATQEKLDRYYISLLENGNLTGRPISAPLGDGIFELRANKARMLFYFGENRTVVFVNCFIKKVRKVPPEEIRLAKKRRTEILSQKVKTNALPN